MAKMVITLVDRKTRETVMVERAYRGNKLRFQIHVEVLGDYPGFFIRKSVIK